MGSSSLAKTIVGLIGAVALVGLLAIAMYHNYTHVFASANDFYIPWRATRILVFEGRDPYSDSVTRDIQMVLFGAPRAPGEHQYAFTYPLYTSLLLAPLTPLPYDAAQALWQAILLSTTLLVVLRLAREARLNPWLSILFALAFYPTARGLILGQLAIVVFAAIALALWAVGHGHERISGVALAVATIKPQVSFLIVPLMLLWALTCGRKNLLSAFGAAMGSMLLISFLWMPTWPLAFFNSMTAYAGYVGVGSPLEIALENFGALGKPLGWLASIALLAWMASETWREAKRGWRHINQLAMLALIISQLIAIGTATTNQIVSLLPLAWLAAQYRSRTLVILVAIIFLIVPWWVFFASVKGKDEQPIAFLPIALGLLILWIAQLMVARQQQTPAVVGSESAE